MGNGKNWPHRDVFLLGKVDRLVVRADYNETALLTEAIGYFLDYSILKLRNWYQKREKTGPPQFTRVSAG